MPGAPVMTRSRTAVGIYGKLPTNGDFLRRGLRAETIADLDCWLQIRLADTPHDWRQEDVSAWRFLASTGVFGPMAILGLLAPSRDRVGRDFPLVVAAEIEPTTDIGHAVSREWLDRAEALMHLARTGLMKIDDLEFALAELGDPTRDQPMTDVVDLAPNRSLWWRSGSVDAAASVVSAPGSVIFEALVAVWRTGAPSNSNLAQDQKGPQS